MQTAAQRRAWREFLRLAVFRYGPGGSFWTENPLLPERPIRIWQIWNEENFKYFAARPSPSQYGKLVVQSYADLRSADSGARIVLGGMFGKPNGGAGKPQAGQIKRAYFATDFLERMYRTTPGVRGKFLAVALHPYTYSYKAVGREVEALRAVLKRKRDPGRALWITEMSWKLGQAGNGQRRKRLREGVGRTAARNGRRLQAADRERERLAGQARLLVLAHRRPRHLQFLRRLGPFHTGLRGQAGLVDVQALRPLNGAPAPVSLHRAGAGRRRTGARVISPSGR
ncbi:MAG: hypothetical protein QM729_11630 [Solirubrobacterales bacterium]